MNNTIRTTSIRINGSTSGRVLTLPTDWQKLKAEIERTVLKHGGTIVITNPEVALNV